MADINNFGIDFPFSDSTNGKYLKMTNTSSKEVRAALIHLLLTRKGTRYFLPDFGTRLLEYIFEPLDGPTFKNIESEIRDSVEKFMPQLQLTNINISAPTGEADEATVTTAGNVINPQLQMTNQDVTEYTATVRIDYSITNDVFNSKDFIILNI